MMMMMMMFGSQGKWQSCLAECNLHLIILWF
jgi:hypothetical protein